jgi:hypothetical protein
LVSTAGAAIANCGWLVPALLSSCCCHCGLPLPLGADRQRALPVGLCPLPLLRAQLAWWIGRPSCSLVQGWWLLLLSVERPAFACAGCGSYSRTLLLPGSTDRQSPLAVCFYALPLLW